MSADEAVEERLQAVPAERNTDGPSETVMLCLMAVVELAWFVFLAYGVWLIAS